MLIKRCYLDYNATSPLLPCVKEEIVSALDLFGNPSSVHSEGRAAKAAMQQARRRIANLLHAEPDNIVFTSGASEAAHFALTPHYQMGRANLHISHLYYGATEHPCISNGGQFHEDNRTIIPVLKNGLIDLEKLEEYLNHHDKTGGLPLVAIQAANHETGILQPIEDIAALTRKGGGLLLVDLVQYIGKKPFDITKEVGDFFIISAHKIGGPKGVGAFIAAGSIVMPKPLIRAGGQEKGLRGGTEALPLIIGFGAAADYAAQNTGKDISLHSLQKMLEDGIEKIAPTAEIYGKYGPRLPNTTFFTVPDIKAETMQIAFDLASFAVSAGAACSSGKVGASAVLKAMGIHREEGAIRVSTGPQTLESDIERFLEEFKNIVMRHKK